MQWRRINHAPSLSLSLCGSGIGSSTISRYNQPSFFLFVSWRLRKDSKDQFPPPQRESKQKPLQHGSSGRSGSRGINWFSETKLHTSRKPSKGSHRRKRMDDGSNSSNLKIPKAVDQTQTKPSTIWTVLCVHRCSVELFNQGSGIQMNHWRWDLDFSTCSNFDFCLLVPFGRNLGSAYSHELCSLPEYQFSRSSLLLSGFHQYDQEKNHETWDIWSTPWYLPPICFI